MNKEELKKLLWELKDKRKTAWEFSDKNRNDLDFKIAVLEYIIEEVEKT